jgi:hypothetical protein
VSGKGTPGNVWTVTVVQSGHGAGKVSMVFLSRTGHLK